MRRSPCTMKTASPRRPVLATFSRSDFSRFLKFFMGRPRTGSLTISNRPPVPVSCATASSYVFDIGGCTSGVGGDAARTTVPATCSNAKAPLPEEGAAERQRTAAAIEGDIHGRARPHGGVGLAQLVGGCDRHDEPEGE